MDPIPEPAFLDLATTKLLHLETVFTLDDIVLLLQVRVNFALVPIRLSPLIKIVLRSPEIVTWESRMISLCPFA